MALARLALRHEPVQLLLRKHVVRFVLCVAIQLEKRARAFKYIPWRWSKRKKFKEQTGRIAFIKYGLRDRTNRKYEKNKTAITYASYTILFRQWLLQQ